MNNKNKVRGVALLTGGVLMVSAMSAPSAQAATKKQYKIGAIAAGVLGAYYATKGKTVPAVIAGAGAYYAYKKSKDADNKYAHRYPDTNDRYARNGDVYPDTGYDSFTSRTRSNARVSVD